MKKEENVFAPYVGAFSLSAFVSSQTIGRRYCLNDLDDDFAFIGALNPFFVDKEKLLQSKALRRLEKTQVFPDRKSNVHIRNRRVHTDEVISIATYIAQILGLNVYLVEAIALGHDIGHSPFGHVGEKAIAEITGRNFRHEVMSVVIAQKIERKGRGLNLSFETLEGIINHSRGSGELRTNALLPLEYAVVMMADKIAYTFSDLNDAVRFGYFKESDLPTELFSLGKNQRERWFNCIFSLVKESVEKKTISFSESEIAVDFEALRQWSYKNFYSKVPGEEKRDKLYSEFRIVHPALQELIGSEKDAVLGLALMTDLEFKRILHVVENDSKKFTKNFLKDFSFFEILSNLPEREVDIFDADLNRQKFFRFDI